MSLSHAAHRLAGKRPSRIGLRLFAFNVLVLIVPVAGILYLDVYEQRLLEAQERGMVQQARLLAAALADADPLDAARPNAILTSINEQIEARVRVFDERGTLLADSARLGSRAEPRAIDEYVQIGNRRSRFLYQVGAKIARIRDGVYAAFRRRPSQSVPLGIPSGGVPPELRLALAGQYGAWSRPTPGQRSLTLNSAVPVFRNGRVVGAVVVSQSTFRLLQALYEVRLRLFQIVLISIVAAAVLTRLASATIVTPIVRLRGTAAALASRQFALSGSFARVSRKDEIGDLARSLEELAAHLEAHIQLLEAVSADIAHEFKNPLAAIRTAAETMADEEDPSERRRFLTMLIGDVDRLERLVSGLRELALIDAQLSTEPRGPIDVSAVVHGLVEGKRLVTPVPIRMDAPQSSIRVSASLDRLSQVFENLIDNAVSFTPANATVDVSVASTGSECLVRVSDRGPGIPPGHIDKVFDRFFSYRPGSPRDHMGLGLSIAKSIVSNYGGTIVCRNREGGGADFEVRLPADTARNASP